MKKSIFLFSFIFIFINVSFPDETNIIVSRNSNFDYLDKFIKSESSQEIEFTKFNFTTNQIQEYIHIKKINQDIYALYYLDSIINIKKINTKKYDIFCERINKIISSSVVFERKNPPGDDMSMIISLSFKGDINISIEMFNSIMLYEEDYRIEIIKLIDELII